MSSHDPDKNLQRRIWAAAILTGHRGLGDFAKALNAPGLSHASLRTMSYETPDLAGKLAAVSMYAKTSGHEIPVAWLMDGFEPDTGEVPDRPAMMSDLAALEDRLAGRRQ